MRRRVEGCARSHGEDQVCCRQHWFQLPQSMRNEIWRLYRREAGSQAHVKAVYDALDYLSGRAAGKAAPS